MFVKGPEPPSLQPGERSGIRGPHIFKEQARMHRARANMTRFNGNARKIVTPSRPSKLALAGLLLLLAFLAGVRPAFAQGTDIIYQGQLYDSGGPANGNYDFTFALYSDLQAGSQIGSSETNLNV